MRILANILTLILFNSCTSKRPIDPKSIQVVRFNQHPWFIDHDRKLITLDENGDIIDELKLYPDSGSGCDSYLFESDGEYILIDCNGQWFRIDKKTGELERDEWEWLKVLPSVKVGIFRRQDNDSYYELVTGEQISVKKVYKYKDPNE